MTSDHAAARLDQSDGPVSHWSRSWLPADVTAVLNGSWQRARPTVGRRTDDIGLFYPGKVHTTSSESEAGKTWFALSGAIDELLAGKHVLYIDFEDDQGSIIGRLLTLQVAAVTIKDRFHYMRPTEPLGTAINRDDLAGTVRSTEPTLIIVDGITEAMSLHGLDPLNNKDIATFGNILPRRLAAMGPAVVCLDHVTKDREGRGRYALGGVHKLNGLDGAAYLLENRTPFGIGLTGRSTIKVAKDRPGQIRRHGLPSSGGMHWFGDLVVISHGEDFAEVEITAPTERDDEFRPTHLMAKIAAVLTYVATPLSGRAIQDRVRGNAANNRTALARLVDDGYVTPAPHTLIKPYAPDGEHDEDDL